jgi:hypothetical protein
MYRKELMMSAAQQTSQITEIAMQTRWRAYGRLSDGTGFEVVKHLGSKRFEIRNLDSIGGARRRGSKHQTLTAEQRAVIAAHPMAAAIRAA